jgi:hypothetical protein
VNDKANNETNNVTTSLTGIDYQGASAGSRKSEEAKQTATLTLMDNTVL